ncbi:chromosome segregation protein [Talaromyces proteolyticus]|uniref:Chromosome segregation protein n=1 Tax=Talaromyces proteolyticus TaxID=1131652 RepID=A0AAD4Q5I0_9EURO|nr:chromosome segregation protein [Talaromyces proteolyticus]KAH8704239.1 chromosome segregation protein [Talaromyces proteolyticus]
MSLEGIRPRPRPAHPPGTTVLTYTSDGRYLITAGSNALIRIFNDGDDGEPRTLEDGAAENYLGVAATKDAFILGAEDGTVWRYDVETGKTDKLLVRCLLPVRDLAISSDGEWLAVASDELTVKIVNTDDMTNVKYLREQTKGSKHVTFDQTGRFIAVSCTDGFLYIYSVESDEPQLVRKLDGAIRRLEATDDATSRAAWHPGGTAIALAQANRDIAIFSTSDWTPQKPFTGGHNGEITAIAWSPNGELLATAGFDGQILLWETNTQKILKRYKFANVTNLSWHPTRNVFSFSTSFGEVYIHEYFVSREHVSILEKSGESALRGGPLGETSGNARKPMVDRSKSGEENGRRRAGSLDSLDDLLGSAGDEDGFVDDDDGAGYAEDVNAFGKRTNGHLDGPEGRQQKRFASYWEPTVHAPFQPGSTPWRGNRCYLCLNLTGAVWTVDQESHNTVTVEFYDSELHRNFHFTDPYRYDKACLNDNGTLFASSPVDSPATIYYRPHETWTTRGDWRTQLPAGETVKAIALSDSYIVALTSANYIRIYTLYGTPFRIYRQKSQAITCAAWRDYVLTIGNGPVSHNGGSSMTYSIENVKRDEICQNEDIVAISEGEELKSVFFSDAGDPCIYDSEGVLLVLQHWRTPGQARWVPLLDTKLLERLSKGRKEETYWPVAVAQDKFHCIILKGGETHPYFPRPLLSEFDFKMPVSTAPPKANEDEAESDTRNDIMRFEESFVRENLFLSLFQDVISTTNATRNQRAELARKEVELDKILLQMLAIECREGEDRGMKALELVEMMRDRSGKMLEAAAKIAQRYNRSILEDKIRELGERRLMGMDEDDELA